MQYYFCSHSGWFTWPLLDSSHSRQHLDFLFLFSLFGQYIYTYVQKTFMPTFFFFSFFYNLMWFTKQDSKITYKEYEYCTKIKLIKLLGVGILQCYRSLVCKTAFWSMCPVCCLLGWVHLQAENRSVMSVMKKVQKEICNIAIPLNPWLLYTNELS